MGSQKLSLGTRVVLAPGGFDFCLDGLASDSGGSSWSCGMSSRGHGDDDGMEDWIICENAIACGNGAEG